MVPTPDFATWGTSGIKVRRGGNPPHAGHLTHTFRIISSNLSHNPAGWGRGPHFTELEAETRGER